MLQQLLNGLQEGSFYSLIALAVVVVMKTTDVPNFAMSDMGLVGAYVSWALWSKGVPMGFAIAASLVFAFVFGAVMQRIIVYPIAAGIAAGVGIVVALTPANFGLGLIVGLAVAVGYTFWAERRGVKTLAGGSHFPLLLSTIGLAIVIVNSVQPIWGTESRNFDPVWRGKPFHIGDAILTRVQLVTIVVGVVLAAALAVFFRSPWGVRMRAIAENRAVASVLGISPSRVSMLAWGLATVISTIAMTLHTQYNSLTPTNGESIIFAGFVAAVIGGFSSLPAAFVGGLMIGTLRGLTAHLISVSWADAVPFLVVFVVLIVKPQGIAARGRAREV